MEEAESGLVWQTRSISDHVPSVHRGLVAAVCQAVGRFVGRFDPHLDHYVVLCPHCRCRGPVGKRSSTKIAV